MSTVFKRAGRPGWYYKFRDERGQWLLRAGVKDKTITQRIAAKAESDAALRAAGLIDPKAEHYLEADVAGIQKHLDDFKNAILSAGNTRKHAQHVYRKAQRLMALAHVEHLTDITLSGVQGGLKHLREVDDLSLQSLTHYVRAVKEFTRWARRDGRMRDDALEPLKTYNAETDRCRERRALNDEEIEKLFTATATAPTRYHMTGADRTMLYLLALSTGFRVGELTALTPASFDLDAPTVTVEAAYSKRRRRDVQPIRADVAEGLRSWLADKPATERLFAMPARTADMFRADLELAGIAYEDDRGRVADLHALRHTYITRLVNSGVNIGVVQGLARHSTPTLTLNRYTDRRVLSIGKALEALPGSPEPNMEPNRNQIAGSTSQHQSRTGKGAERRGIADRCINTGTCQKLA